MHQSNAEVAAGGLASRYLLKAAVPIIDAGATCIPLPLISYVCMVRVYFIETAAGFFSWQVTGYCSVLGYRKV